MAFVLIVILIIPSGVDDIQQEREMPSLRECLSTAQAWLEQDISASGGIGLLAACRVSPAHGDPA